MGDEVLLDKIEGKPGDKIQLDKVIFLGADEKRIFHQEELSKAKVKAVIAEQFKNEKITVFKYKPKKGYRCKRGHRQLLTRVRIEEISFGEVKPKKKIKAEKTREETKAVEKSKKAKVSAKKSAKGAALPKKGKAEPKGKK